MIFRSREGLFTQYRGSAEVVQNSCPRAGNFHPDRLLVIVSFLSYYFFKIKMEQIGLVFAFMNIIYFYSSGCIYALIHKFSNDIIHTFIHKFSLTSLNMTSFKRKCVKTALNINKTL